MIIMVTVDKREASELCIMCNMPSGNIGRYQLKCKQYPLLRAGEILYNQIQRRRVPIEDLQEEFQQMLGTYIVTVIEWAAKGCLYAGKLESETV